MAATLADGGVNPVTHERVLDAASCRYALAVMATAGLARLQATGWSTSDYQVKAE